MFFITILHVLYSTTACIVHCMRCATAEKDVIQQGCSKGWDWEEVSPHDKTHISHDTTLLYIHCVLPCRSLGGCLDPRTHCYTLEVSFFSYTAADSHTQAPYTEETCIPHSTKQPLFVVGECPGVKIVFAKCWFNSDAFLIQSLPF